MSSTGRGHRLGGAEDFFRTPSWPVRRLLEAWRPPGGVWLEPGAGSGSIIRAVNAVRKDVRWISVEVRASEGARLAELCVHTFVGDFLVSKRMPTRPDISVVLGNAPFLHAQGFIERSREVAPNAMLAFLLRLNFAGSEERAVFMRKFPPDVKVLPNRPSFSLRQTDSAEYAWLLWPPYERSHGTFEILGSTSAEERQRDMPTVGQCKPCFGLGWFDKNRVPVVKKTPGAVMCIGCYGHGKINVSWPEDRGAA